MWIKAWKKKLRAHCKTDAAPTKADSGFDLHELKVKLGTEVFFGGAGRGSNKESEEGKDDMNNRIVFGPGDTDTGLGLISCMHRQIERNLKDFFPPLP